MTRPAETGAAGVSLGLAPASLRPVGPARIVGGVRVAALDQRITAATAPPVRLTFSRPAWQLLWVSYFLVPLTLGVLALPFALGPIGAALATLPCAAAMWVPWRLALFRIRACWDEDTLVLEGWPRAIGVRVARAELVDVWVGADHVVLRTKDGFGLPLVVRRWARRGDRELACDLARGLGLPLVDDTGELAQLPAAIVRHGGEAP
jgi:hypothetical protein